MSRMDRCADHPTERRNGCRVCLGDHKAGEHRGHPSPECIACRVNERVADFRHTQAVDAMRRAANDR